MALSQADQDALSRAQAAHPDLAAAGIDLAGIARRETGGEADPDNAVNPNSGAGGLGQILASTATNPGYGVKPISPADRFDRDKNAGFMGDYTHALLERGMTREQVLRQYSGGGYSSTDPSASSNASTLAAVGGAADQLARSLGIIDQATAAKAALQAPILANMQQRVGADQAQFDRVAKDYTPFQPTPAPKQPENDPLKGFASIGAIFAGLASGLSHTPAVAAMNGMARAVNATHDNDWKAYETEYKTWRDSTQDALEKHRLQSNDMKDALDAMKTNLSAGVAMMQAVATQSDDKITTELLKSGQYSKIAELMIHRDEAAQSWQEHANKIQEDAPKVLAAGALKNAIINRQAANQSGDPDKMAKAEQEYQRAVQGSADANNPQRGVGGNTPQAIALQRYLQQYPNATAEDVQKFIQGFKPANSGYSPPVSVTTKGPDGKDVTKLAQQDKSTGGWVTADANRDPIENVTKISKPSASSTRSEMFLQRQFTSGKDAITDIKNLTELPINVSTGIFGGRKQGPGLMDATKEMLANKMSGEEVQALNTQMAGLERALGGLASGGLQPGEAVQDSFAKLKIVSGDTYMTKLRKLATMRQNVDNALDSMALNSGITDKQTAAIDDMKAQLADAVPYSVHDVNEVEFSTDKNISISSFAKKALPNAAAPAMTITVPDPKAVEMLKKDPGSRGHFDEVFGPGAAAKVLGN